MGKNQLIYEKKTAKGKPRKYSFRTTDEQGSLIDKKYDDSGMSSKTEFIVNACTNNEIIIVPEGKEILKAVYEIRNILQTNSPHPMAEEVNSILSGVVIHLRNLIS